MTGERFISAFGAPDANPSHQPTLSLNFSWFFFVSSVSDDGRPPAASAIHAKMKKMLKIYRHSLLLLTWEELTLLCDLVLSGIFASTLMTLKKSIIFRSSCVLMEVIVSYKFLPPTVSETSKIMKGLKFLSVLSFRIVTFLGIAPIRLHVPESIRIFIQRIIHSFFRLFCPQIIAHCTLPSL